MNNFKKCRKDRHLTMDKVANNICVNKDAIYRIENGKNNPSVANLLKLAELYKVSTDYLLGKTECENFAKQYEYLQSLEDDELLKELDLLNINEWTTKSGKIYSKLYGKWYITVR